MVLRQRRFLLEPSGKVQLLLAPVLLFLLVSVGWCDDYCDSMSGEPTEECAAELSCYGCTVPVLNLDKELQTTFEQCVHSESNGGKLAKCYKSDSKACAVVKMYNKDPSIKPYYLRGCVGEEDDHYRQVCVSSSQVLLRRFCYNTLRNIFGVNLPTGKQDADMADWSCTSICCTCDGCNKNFAKLDTSDAQCEATMQNNTVNDVREWYRSSMDQTPQQTKAGNTSPPHPLMTQLKWKILTMASAVVLFRT